MIKRILLTIVMLLLIAYLVAAVTVFNDKPAHQVCRDMELVIKDTLNAGFVTKNEVAAILQKKGIYPVGKKMDRVHTKTLEKELDKHPLINEAQCYKTPNGKICVEVTQRVPILHIMSSNGENYYLDNKGKMMPPDAKCVAHRAIVTGNVEKSFAMKDLYKFGVFLQNNKFWDAQIEQIHGTGMTLVPLKVYLKNGFAKVLLGIAKGKHDYDKRESIKRREQERDIKRIIKSVNR